MKLKIEKYDNHAWQVTPSYVVPQTYVKGVKAGQPHPNAGAVVWNTNGTRYPGNLKALAKWLLEYTLPESMVVDTDHLTAAFETLSNDIDNGVERIIAALEQIDGGTIVL